jgi:hypothetical protein
MMHTAALSFAVVPLYFVFFIFTFSKGSKGMKKSVGALSFVPLSYNFKQAYVKLWRTTISDLQMDLPYP